jgi:hypothetical protein
MNRISSLLDYNNTNSFVNAIRRRRHQIFIEFLRTLPQKTFHILDVGGDYHYWVQNHLDTGGLSARIVLLNLRSSLPADADRRFSEIIGDARQIPFQDKKFDVVFSNSVIEHLLPGDQRLMSKEVARVGCHYFIQTPYRYFPLDPHTYIPFFPVLPLWAKAALIRCFPIYWHQKQGSWEKSLKEAQNINMLSLSMFKRLFPEAAIHREMLLGLCKSLIAIY